MPTFVNYLLVATIFLVVAVAIATVHTSRKLVEVNVLEGKNIAPFRQFCLAISRNFVYLIKPFKLNCSARKSDVYFAFLRCWRNKLSKKPRVSLVQVQNYLCFCH